MHQRLAHTIRHNWLDLVDRYDAQLRAVPGYAGWSEMTRRDLEQHVLTLMADCLEKNDDQAFIGYIHEHAEQVLTRGFEPEWFQRSAAIAQNILTPLVQTLEESNFVWQAMSRAQAAAWDIVARKRQQIEATLRESETRYQTIFDSTPIMFWLKDTQNRTLRINKAAAALEGVNPADVEGKSAYDLYPREQAEAFYQDDLEVIRSGKPKIGIVEQHTSVGTGDMMWVETGKTPVRNEQGEIIGVLAFAVNITDRKRAESRLQESEERFRSLFETANDAIFLMQGDQFIDCNAKTLEIFQCPREQILHQSPVRFSPPRQPDGRDSFEKAMEKIQGALAGQPQVFEWQHIHYDGTPFEAEVSLNRLGLGEEVFVQAIVRDITVRKQLEQQVRESLARRDRQVQTATEVAQDIASAPELGELFHRVVTLIKERFNYYHAQLFHYDPTQDAVVLVSGYGEAGQKMLSAGHKLVMGRGIVGTAAATGRSILATDVTHDLDWRPNPNLPDTKGELAVPIKLGGSDAEAQVNALRYFVNGDFDGVAVAAVDPAAAAIVTRDALHRDKPVVALTSDLGQENQTALIYSIEHELGYLLGVQAGAWAKEHLPSGQTLKLGMLNYRILLQVIQRENGIIDGIKSVIGERVTIVASGSAIGSTSAASLAEGWLRDYPDLNMIVAINDASALGAYQAAQAMGYNDPERFFIGGIDAVPEALAAIQQGGIYQATVNQPPEIMGLMAVRTLVAAIKRLAVKPTYTLYCTPVNRTNVDQFSGPYREAAMLANQDLISAESLAGMEGSGLRLGLSVLSLANPFFARLVESAQREAKRLGVQLFVNDPRRVLGVLDVQTDRVNALSDDDRLLLEGLCGQIAIAMESTRLLDNVQQSEQLMRTLIDAIPDYIYAKDLAGRHILDNVAFAQLHGLSSPDQMLGKTDFDFYPGELAERYRVVELPILQEGKKLLGQEEPSVDTAGNWRWNSTTKVPLRNQAGAIIGLVGVTTDITKRKQAEADLRKFELGLDRSTAAVFITDREGVITYVNPAFEKIYGYSREEAIGQTPRILKSGLISRDQYQTFWSTLLSGQTAAGEIINKTKDGRLLIIDGSNNPILDETGTIVGFLGIHNDVTERRQAEQKNQETLHEVERLYAAVSHEGWGIYRHATELPEGYLYDRIHLQPLEHLSLPAIQQAVEQGQLVKAEIDKQLVAASPLAVRGEIIGAIGVYDDPEHPLPPEDLALVEAISEQVALALESARLFEQTQAAWTEAEQLYRIGVSISTATTLDDLLQATISPAMMAGASSASIWSLDLNEAGQLGVMELEASWAREGAVPTPVGTRFSVAEYPSSKLWLNETSLPSFIENTALDERVDPQMRTMFLQHDMAAATFVPLAIGKRWVGLIIVSWREPREFTASEQRMYQSIASQVAVALENRRLFAQTQAALADSQARARREQILREVTARVRNSTNPDTVMRTLARELNAVLDRPTFVQLAVTDHPTRPGGNGHRQLGEGGKTSE